MTLTPLSLPTADNALDWADSRCAEGLAAARRIADELRAERPTDAMDVLNRWNDLELALANVDAAASVFSEIHPDPAVRARCEQGLQDSQALHTELAQDSDLYAVFSALTSQGLEPGWARLLEHTLRDFRRAGVDLPPQQRTRVKELIDRQLVVSQEFSKNIREGVRTIRVRPEQLDGMPQDWLDAHPADSDGLVAVTTDYPDAVPVRTFCHDRQVRHEMAVAMSTVAWPANDALLQELFALRAEHAQLLGFTTWADYDADVKMIGKGPAIGEFIDQITELARERAVADKAQLLERLRRDVADADDITSADSTYYSEVVRREEYAVDAQQVRRYFDFTAVRQGMLDVTGRLFGLTFSPADDLAPWHEDIASYDVQFGGERIGRIHLDLFPREGKYKHAAMFELTKGVAGRQLAEGVLVCNFNRGLMEHDEVKTLFHEFGHLLHHVLAGRMPWARFSGVATEWDFVEAPSQMLEEWSWDPAVLATFAQDETGESIPADLVEKMRRANAFGKGTWARTQMFYASLSYDFHIAGHDDLTQRLRELQGEYNDFPYIDGTHMHCSFGHLDGYSSGYYTYMWSLVIAKDLFSAFDVDDLFDPEVAGRYRDLVLAQGGSRDAADLVEDFLGRPYAFDAFGAWLQQ